MDITRDWKVSVLAYDPLEMEARQIDTLSCDGMIHPKPAEQAVWFVLGDGERLFAPLLYVTGYQFLDKDYGIVLHTYAGSRFIERIALSPAATEKHRGPPCLYTIEVHRRGESRPDAYDEANLCIRYLDCYLAVPVDSPTSDRNSSTRLAFQFGPQ